MAFARQKPAEFLAGRLAVKHAARKAGASAEQIALIAAAVDACADAVASEEPPHA